MTPRPIESVVIPREFQLRVGRECPFGDGGPVEDVPQTSYAYFQRYVVSQAGFDPRLESSVAIYFDDKKRLLGHILLDQGGESWVSVAWGMASVVAEFAGASGAVLIHNHPGGNAAPSDTDLLVVRTLRSQGKFGGIRLLDFITAGDGQFFSAAGNGLLDEEPADDGVDASVAAKDNLWLFAAQVLLPDETLQAFVRDAAFKAGRREVDFVCDFLRDILKRHLKAEPYADPKMSFAAHVLAPNQKPLMAASIKRAADDGLPIWDSLWFRGVRLLRQDLESSIPAQDVAMNG
jgi:hypothetical protein